MGCGGGGGSGAGVAIGARGGGGGGGESSPKFIDASCESGKAKSLSAISDPVTYKQMLLRSFYRGKIELCGSVL